MAETHGPLLHRPRHDDIRLDVVEGLVREIHTGSLDRVMKVSLRLMALASFAAAPDRRVLLEQVEQLDTAVRNVRAMFFRGNATSRPDAAADPESGRAEVALLDRDGVIVWTNRAWDDFCRRNGGDPRRAAVGRSYLGILRRRRRRTERRAGRRHPCGRARWAPGPGADDRLLPRPGPAARIRHPRVLALR